MIIVPVVPQPSARARALAERLRATIADAKARDAKLTREEIEQALREVTPSPRGRADQRPAVILAVIAGVGTAIGVGLLADSAQGGRSLPVAPMLAVAILGLGVVAALVLRSRNDR